jgi:hypothetical protein
LENLKEYFLEKLKNFIDFSKKNKSPAKIRTEYLWLLKEFQPDENNIDSDTAEECKHIIRGMYNKILKEKDRTRAYKAVPQHLMTRNYCRRDGCFLKNALRRLSAWVRRHFHKGKRKGK